jgi:hypothetical protein
VRKIFECPIKCAKWESKFLKKINAEKNTQFLNKKNGDEKWNRTGVPTTTFQKESVSRATKNIPRTDEVKFKIGQSKIGKKLSESHKESIRKTLGKEITTPLGTFESIKCASIKHGCSTCKMRKFIITKPEEYYFTNIP